MSIQFNGQVTINGNVEMFDNGSMKIIGNQVDVNIKDLQNFIEDNLKYSSNKKDYLEAAKIIESSNDKSKIKDAIVKLKSMAQEKGKSIFFSGLSTIAVKTIKETLN